MHFGCVELGVLMRPPGGELSLEAGEEVIVQKRSLFWKVTY